MPTPEEMAKNTETNEIDVEEINHKLYLIIDNVRNTNVSMDDKQSQLLTGYVQELDTLLKNKAKIQKQRNRPLSEERANNLTEYSREKNIDTANQLKYIASKFDTYIKLVDQLDDNGVVVLDKVDMSKLRSTFAPSLSELDAHISSGLVAFQKNKQKSNK